MKSSDKIFRSAIAKLTLGLCVLFPLINVGYFFGLYGLTTVFQNSAVTKILCSIQGPSVFDEANKNYLGISETCSINDVWRTALVLGSLLVLLVGITLWYVRRTLKPIRFAHSAQKQFSMSALHQMQTPLSIMRSQIDNAALSSKKTDTITLDSLKDELLTLERTTKSLVQLTKPTEAQFTQIKELKTILKSLSSAHKINAYITINKAVAIPMSREDVYMIIDIALGNIAKHAGTNNADIIVTKKNRKIYLIVSDKGTGFAQKSDSELSKLQATGHGIGLNIITIIAHKYGGTLRVKSKKGTTLRISVPNIKQASA
jgi:signal transduction histidine kinase